MFLSVDHFERNLYRELESLHFKGKWRGSGSGWDSLKLGQVLLFHLSKEEEEEIRFYFFNMQTSSSLSAVQSSISEVGALCLTIAHISSISMSNNVSDTILSARNDLTQEQLNGELTHHHRRSSDPPLNVFRFLYFILIYLKLCF